MTRYEVLVIFKDHRQLEITTDSEEDLKEILVDEWPGAIKEGAISIGEYIISANDILYTKIKGDRFEKKNETKDNRA